MKILEKYIGKSVILSSLVILACLIGIFSFFSLIENLSEHDSSSGIIVFFEYFHSVAYFDRIRSLGTLP